MINFEYCGGIYWAQKEGAADGPPFCPRSVGTIWDSTAVENDTCRAETADEGAGNPPRKFSNLDRQTEHLKYHEG